uniref:Leucine-rich repeat-containing N-terminal plant-type domain-containing protein n=1 Tax=Nelumbo nucifera TaxID=4432 RepID=A0A822XSB7_NELNU|nr:TPA_asm: hypothetical protein HUJ06_025958 [Nelumbo nucifera]
MRFHLLLLILLYILNNHRITGRPLRIPEYHALLSIKTAISDNPQASLLNLNLSTSHCTWTSVSCDSFNRVVSLDLSNMNLSSILSPDVGQLRNLINLTTAAKFFSGPVPSEVSDISDLRLLNLSNNVFNGPFPSEFSRLKLLEVLNLYNNNMTGDLPIGVSEMPNL